MTTSMPSACSALTDVKGRSKLLGGYKANKSLTYMNVNSFYNDLDDATAIPEEKMTPNDAQMIKKTLDEKYIFHHLGGEQKKLVVEQMQMFRL